MCYNILLKARRQLHDKEVQDPYIIGQKDLT
jgi:hypothetical protein